MHANARYSSSIFIHLAILVECVVIHRTLKNKKINKVKK